MTTRPTSVDGYLAQQPPATRAPLRQVLSLLRKAMPGAEEAISYGIPAFKVGGRTVLYLAGWKAHYSLYPSSRALELAFRRELARYELSHKGTIRFPLDEPVPAGLILRIAKFRLKESAQRADSRQTVSKGPRRSTRTASSRRARRR
jgi:uncharacterized protein YdhG (YjbR/CyaY superfamily)